MDHWQPFVPGSGDYRARHSDSHLPAVAGEAPVLGLSVSPGPAPSAAPSAGQEERARTLSLIDFLADYDATRNPPSTTSAGTACSCSARLTCRQCLESSCLLHAETAS
jgi:hypothetical protein